MPDTKIDICNRALIELGANTIADFSSDTTESKVASLLYDATVRKVLSRYPWGFATKGHVANLIESENVTGYDRAYQLPADCVAVWNVRDPGGSDLPTGEWEVYGTEVHCNGGGETMEVDYTRVVGEALFPAHFTEALEIALMHRFCGPLSHSGSMRDALGKEFERVLSLSKNSDGRQRHARRIQPTRFLAVRR